MDVDEVLTNLELFFLQYTFVQLFPVFSCRLVPFFGHKSWSLFEIVTICSKFVPDFVVLNGRNSSSAICIWSHNCQNGFLPKMKEKQSPLLW